MPVGNKTGANCVIHLLNNASHSNLVLIPIKEVLVNLRIIHFTLSQFLNAVLYEWHMSDLTN